MNIQNQQLKIWLGLLILYIVWGSTYLALRFVVESVPSMMASGFRNFIAGTVLFLFSIVSKKFQKPSRKLLITVLVSGFLMLTFGNGLFTIAARWIPSSYSALFSALGPVILVVLLWVINHQKPKKNVVLGAILGIIGVCILMSLKTLALKGYEQYYGLGVFFLFLATLGWNLGVVLVKKANINHYHTTQISGMQMMIGGIISLIISYYLGEFDHFQFNKVESKAYFSFLYLVSFGSILAFLVFGWLSKVTEPTLVATYTYINPLVAMLLGWLFGGERLHPLMLLAGGVIITAVILITSAKSKPIIENV
jgi:drug/metabolite transporter (DMT)-like permease